MSQDPDDRLAAGPDSEPESTDPESGPVEPGQLFGELRSGDLGVRLARDDDDIDAVQALRYRVFYEEMGARPDEVTLVTKRDRDDFDSVADHLLVVDHSLGEGPAAAVGTYRLIQREGARKLGHFYSADEYDIAKIEAYEGRIMELGRSCVAAGYRNRSVMQLLWRGIAAYVFHHRIDLMFGCASLPGTDPDMLATELTYLYYYHLAPAKIRPRALPHRYIEMRRLDRDEVDARAALSLLPPLVKGYLRLGGFVGDGAVIDAQFNTTDVAVVVQTDLVTDKYYRHYERQAREPQD
ncbi:MAG TPA: GNAT family N-acyltransferase [Rhodopila sp.]|uniref:GNAT family N-acetyltransferase n=1 Tax=Rhodopila sp. TaxID=2480087 RepID=UPI002C58EB84|nr:GNAT family N-acyltransferase [Rhodopila sp.]HVY17062.1 GNAT family N-acyltransferase [Rhodopila sp.]